MITCNADGKVIKNDGSFAFKGSPDFLKALTYKARSCSLLLKSARTVREKEELVAFKRKDAESAAVVAFWEDSFKGKFANRGNEINLRCDEFIKTYYKNLPFRKRSQPGREVYDVFEERYKSLLLSFLDLSAYEKMGALSVELEEALKNGQLAEVTVMLEEAGVAQSFYPEKKGEMNVQKQLNRIIAEKFAGFEKTENFCEQNHIEYFPEKEKMNLLTQVLTMSDSTDPAILYARLITNTQRIRNKLRDREFEKENNISMSLGNSSIKREEMVARDLSETPESNYYVWKGVRKQSEINEAGPGRDTGPLNRLSIWGQHLKAYLEENIIYEQKRTETENAGDIINGLPFDTEKFEFSLDDNYKVIVNPIKKGATEAQVDIIRSLNEGEEANSSEKGKQVVVHGEWKILSEEKVRIKQKEKDGRKEEVKAYWYPSSKSELFSRFADEMITEPEHDRKFFYFNSLESPVQEKDITPENKGAHLYIDDNSTFEIKLNDAININPKIKEEDSLFRPNLSDLRSVKKGKER